MTRTSSTSAMETEANTFELHRIVDQLIEENDLSECDLLCFYSQAFGHQATILDALNRISQAEPSLCVIIITDKRFNHTLTECFPHIRYIIQEAPPSLDIYSCHQYSRWCAQELASHPRVNRTYYQESFYEYLMSYTLNDRQYLIGDSSTNALGYRLQTPAEMLIQNSVGPCLAFPKAKISICQEIITRIVLPSFSQNTQLVYIHTRRKTSQAASCLLRSVSDYSQYTALVQSLVSDGYQVIVGGDADIAVGDTCIQQVGKLSSVTSPITRNLLNIYLLSCSDIFVGHQSGPNYVAASAGVPQFISNAFPHCLGTNGLWDISIYKKIFFKERLLSYEIIATEQKLHRIHYGIINNSDYSVVENTANEILESFSIFQQSLNAKSINPLLFKRKRDLTPSLHSGTPMRMHRSHPSNIVQNL